MKIAYVAHTLRSDWNNGNAHSLRGLLRGLGSLGCAVVAIEPETEWSIENLRADAGGERSLAEFARVYPELVVYRYGLNADDGAWRKMLDGQDVVILHEWNPPALAARLLRLRAELGFRLLFHDTHHRASSSPESFAEMGLAGFDGVLVFGEALRRIYRERFGVERCWTLHEAADTSVFRPLPGRMCEQDVVWIGNWGEGERAAELREFLVGPAGALERESAPQRVKPPTSAATVEGRADARYTFKVFGVRYPEDGLQALEGAGIAYGGYLPNLDAVETYARSRLTLHVPRQQYSAVMTGIPTIRVFEALACGIPLISAPWEDSEALFRPGDFLFVRDGAEMTEAMRRLLADPDEARAQAARGLETVLARHTCVHRARELMGILEEMG